MLQIRCGCGLTIIISDEQVRKLKAINQVTCPKQECRKEHLIGTVTQVVNVSDKWS